MTEQPNHGHPNNGQPNSGQPNQPPYPYAQSQGQPPYPQQPQQPGYQGPPQQQSYQSPSPQQPYPQQQYGAPQPYPQQPHPPGPPQQAYPQVPPQQYPGQPGQPYAGQPYPGQAPYGQPPQGPNQLQDPDQTQTQPKPKKKRSGCAWFFIILFSPFIALAFVLYGIFWLLAWLLTPVALVLHFVFCGLGLIWYSGVKVLASGRSKYRLLQPVYPKFPPFWTGQYWVRLNRNVRSAAEVLGGIGDLLNW